MTTARFEGPCFYGVLLGWAMRRSARRRPLLARLRAAVPLLR